MAYKMRKVEKCDWLKAIPYEWKCQRVKTLFSLREERSFLPLSEVNLLSLYSSIGVRQHKDIEHTTGNKVRNSEGYKKVYPNDIVVNILLCWMGAIGRSEYEGVISPAYDIYMAKTELNTKYYHYLFRTSLFSQQCYRSGKGIMAMRWRTYSPQFSNIIVPVPPRSEQDQIVRYLDWQVSKINRLIQAKKKEISLLFDLIQVSLFSDDGSHISIGSFDDAFPPNWNTEKAKWIFTERAIKGNVNYELLAVTQDRGVLFKKDCSQNYVVPSDLATQKLVMESDYIISLRSFQGGIETSHIAGLVSAAYSVFSLRDKFSKYQDYFELLFKSKPFIEYMNLLIHDIRDGKKINYYDFERCILPLPPDSVLARIRTLKEIYVKKNAQFNNLRLLFNELKSKLISDVVTGQLDVRGIEVPDYEYVEDEAEETDEESDDSMTEEDGQ